MDIKFHSNDLKTVGGVWDTIFHHKTNCPTNLISLVGDYNGHENPPQVLTFSRWCLWASRWMESGI